MNNGEFYKSSEKRKSEPSGENTAQDTFFYAFTTCSNKHSRSVVEVKVKCFLLL